MSRGWIFGIALYAHVAPLAIYVSREMQLDRTEPVKPVHVELRASTVKSWHAPCEPRPASCDEEEIVSPECECPRRPALDGPRLVTPSRFHLASGNPDLPPPDDVIAQARIDGKGRLVSFYKVCVDARGAVTHVSRLKSSGYAKYDAIQSSVMWTWRYAPVLDHGHPIAACTAVKVLYEVP